MKFTGEILILLLLLTTNGRIFFLKRAKRDRIVVFAPLSFILSILLFLAWGFDIFTIAIFILALLVLLSNFHAMFRYSEHLYIDHYSPLMYLWCIITTLLGLIFLAGTVYFAPFSVKSSRIGVIEDKYYYTGNFTSSFEESNIAFRPSLEVFKFSPENSEISQNQIIIFFPDKTADTYHYRPYLQQLAKEGYTIYSGDFYSKDCKWIHSIADSRLLRRNYMSIEKAIQKDKFMHQKEFYNYNISLECREMYKIIKNLENHSSDTSTENDEFEEMKIILAGDEMSSSALKDFYNANKTQDANLQGFFLMNQLASYQTPGFGCIKQTDPLLSTLLGYSRDYYLTDVQKMVEETKYLTKTE